MSLPIAPRGLLRHIGVEPTRTGKNAGKESHRQKRPIPNKSEPAFPSPYCDLRTAAAFARCLGAADVGANRKRTIFFVNTALIVFVASEPGGVLSFPNPSCFYG